MKEPPAMPAALVLSRNAGTFFVFRIMVVSKFRVDKQCIPE